jgi:hypothetical protein
MEISWMPGRRTPRLRFAIYSGQDASTAEIIDGRALELFVLSWLSAAAEAAEPGELSESAQAFLIGSRLFEALRGAAVAFEPA